MNAPHESASKPAALADYPAVLRWPVQWGDQDAFRHVNNTIYFRWCESARIAYMEALGFNEMFERVHIGPILAHIGCNFRLQVNFPDWIQIGTRTTRLGRTSIGIAHALFSESQQAIVAEAESTIVVYHYQKKQSEPIPAEIREAIETLEGRKFE